MTDEAPGQRTKQEPEPPSLSTLGHNSSWANILLLPTPAGTAAVQVGSSVLPGKGVRGQKEHQAAEESAQPGKANSGNPFRKLSIYTAKFSPMTLRAWITFQEKVLAQLCSAGASLRACEPCLLIHSPGPQFQDLERERGGASC